MITKDFVEKVNPKQKTYNPKYSEGTYKFLHKNKNNNIKVYWRKKNNISGSVTNFDSSEMKFYPTQVYFMYEVNGDWLGTSWTNIMRNEYKVMDYSSFEMVEFEDITDWFIAEYVKVGRCLFDREHINFLLGENYEYVTDDQRFEVVDGVKKCRWCRKEV